ncbi:MAG: chorismate synthase, partial [Acidimicrobiia bacterium]
MLRFLTAGESHGPGLVTIVEGLPAGIEIRADGMAEQLRRRRLGFGRGRRMQIEQDELEILGGVRHGFTLGSPLAVVIRNSEWAKWSEEMSPEAGQPKRVMATPRPGHADLAGMLKYDTHDARDILERASARETAARTIVGYAAGQLLRAVDIFVLSHVVAIGSLTVPEGRKPGPEDLNAIDESPVRVFAREAEAAMTEAIELAKANRDTLGGVVEVLAFGVPAGLGSHVHWDRRL